MCVRVARGGERASVCQPFVCLRRPVCSTEAKESFALPERERERDVVCARPGSGSETRKKMRV